MLQGTGSDVGKSLLVAGLARALTRRGLTVRPFKPQNMSNNAAVTAEGGEIGRAQALQARACGVPPSVHMNPILLKPQSDMGSQIVVQGKVFGQAKARDYYTLKPTLLPKILESFALLRAEADIVLVEGAGSPAEVNLRAGDIANMGFAEAADVPVVLVADIDRGGVIASLIGTHALLTDGERGRLVGYIVNKFRGDKSLFTSALDIIADRTGMDCHGVLPWFGDAHLLPAEDAVALDTPSADRRAGDGSEATRPIRIAVPRLPRIANFDDLDPLRAEPDVEITIVPAGKPLPLDADLILLPGSKTTIGDLTAFRNEGWDIDLHAHIRRGGWVLGLCAGYQMLGKRLSDPKGIEGPAGDTAGLGWLDIETEIAGDKALREVTARELTTGKSVSGYEMHMGVTAGPGLASPMAYIAGRMDGAVDATGRVMGCYLHGLFAADGFRHAFLNRLREGRTGGSTYDASVERVLDRLADHMEDHLDIDALLAAAR
ncbi:cobyric acid synthase [Hwanghaeella grinnelliae]|uniref:Cobyric acid synthase n=2 Tax=Hwanghaeella grinnelliae TaxID=2500179 RepID=A0A3S2VN84_9PROT|nr:cobyric acid synthase [Hwanghaeella grinnelliae]